MLPSITQDSAMPTPSWYRRSIGPGSEGPDVNVVLRKLGLDQDQPYGELAVARIKGVARKLGIWDHDGVVDEAIAFVLGEAATTEAGLMPEWFSIRLGDTGSIVARAARLLGQDTNEFTAEMEAAVRRFQSSSRIEPTGVLDAETARALGEL
jgi:peptidoglycan hydrolase-like protein with peptidoglycan-binding domain